MNEEARILEARIEEARAKEAELEKLRTDNDKKREKSFISSIVSITLFVLVVFLIFSAQTYAFFTDSANSEQNRIVSGELNIELIEMKEDENGQEIYTNPVRIAPGIDVSKIVMVKNTGSLPVYVRIKIEKSINKPENEMPVGWAELISCNFDLDGNLWTYHDGYYYYNIPLDSGSATTPLFDTVSFSKDMGNEFTNSEIKLSVVCQSTQANGNTNSPITAVGWPPETVAETVEVSDTTDESNDSLITE